MSLKIHPSICVMSFVAVFSTTHHTAAAISVIGNSIAHACYEDARQAAPLHVDIANCNRALEDEALDTRDRAATMVNRGIIRMFAANDKGALADYNGAIELQPHMGDAYLNRGILYLRTEKDADAIADLTKGLSLGSTKPEAGYYSRAIAFELAGDVKSAYLDYRKALELAPKWALPQEQLTRFQVKTKTD